MLGPGFRVRVSVRVRVRVRPKSPQVIAYLPTYTIINRVTQCRILCLKSSLTKLLRRVIE